MSINVSQRYSSHNRSRKKPQTSRPHSAEFNPGAKVYVVRSSGKAHKVRCSLCILVKGVGKAVLSRYKKSVMSERRQANLPDVKTASASVDLGQHETVPDSRHRHGDAGYDH